MKNLKLFVEKVIYTYDIEISELQSIIAKLIIGTALLIYLIVHPAILNGFSNTIDSFGIAIFFLATAIAHVFGLVKENVEIRKYANLAACVMWVFVSHILFNKFPIASFFTMTFVLSSSLAYLRLSRVFSNQTEGNDEKHTSTSGTLFNLIFGRAVRIHSR